MISLPNPPVFAQEYKTETQDFINHLLDEVYDVDVTDIQEFITVHGEDNFVEYYEQYVKHCVDFSPESVNAFVEEFGVDSLSHFQDAYQGEYNSPEDFADQLVADCYSLDIPNFVSIDWTATWNNLEYDYIYNDGFVFNRNF